MGAIAGMLCVVIEDTVRVIGERQLSALSALAGALAGTITGAGCFSAIERGVSDQKDMPWTLTYLFEEEGKRLSLVAKTGFEGNHPAACRRQSRWTPVSVADSRASGSERRGDDGKPGVYFPDLPRGSWDKPPARARLVPIARQGQEKPAGIFIAALNPYRAARCGLRGFSGPGGGADCGQHHQCTGLRRRAEARRRTGGTGSSKDRVFQQREP